ncbi:MAG: DUF4982 domain-containing protein [Eisenbergiella massiliensis]
MWAAEDISVPDTGSACLNEGFHKCSTTNDLHLSWDVAYEPGVLRAEGFRNGSL